MRDTAEITKHFLWHFILHDKWTVPNLQDSIEYLVTEAVEAMQERLRLPGTQYHRTNPRESTIGNVATEVWDTEFMAQVIFQQVLGIEGAEVGLDKLLHKCDKFDIERMPRWRTRAECALAGLEPYQMYFEEFSYAFPYTAVLHSMQEKRYPKHMLDAVQAYITAEEEFNAYLLYRMGVDFAVGKGIGMLDILPTDLYSWEVYAACMETALLDTRRIRKDIFQTYKESSGK